MPSSMIHLLTAYKVDCSAPPIFFIGNIAPDAVSPWQKKDITHFRNCKNRMDALSSLAGNISNNDLFAEGALLHLYLDWCWDIGPFKDFTEKYDGLNWLEPYTDEIIFASAWLYHHVEWFPEICQDMLNCPISAYRDIQGTTKEEAFAYIKKTCEYYAKNNVGPSTAYPVEFVDRFTTDVVNDYKKWRKEV